jgi:predicted nucleic-acid-binding protein
MGADVWIDANVVLRYLIRDDENLFALASRVMEMAEKGEVRLHVSPLTVAELVWVLDSFYDYPRNQVADVVSSFVMAGGVAVEERDLIIKALEDYSTLNVDFIDAYIAARAHASGWPVVAFDRGHFKKLGVEQFIPD